MGLWLEPIEMPESGHSWGSLDDEACLTRLRPQTGMAIAIEGVGVGSRSIGVGRDWVRYGDG